MPTLRHYRTVLGREHSAKKVDADKQYDAVFLSAVLFDIVY